MMIMAALLGRTAEQGSRQLVWAAVGGAGREFELRGAYVDKADIKEVSDYVLSDDGAVAQRRIWVRHHALWSLEPDLRVFNDLGRIG